jgi:hypothetical protein
MLFTVIFRYFQTNYRYVLSVPYWTTVEEMIKEYNVKLNANVRKVYNEYGQLIPNDYRIQKTDLELYLI